MTSRGKTIQRGRNQHYQKKLAAQIEDKTTATFALLMDTLKIHLNVGQNITINTSSLFMSLEILTIQALPRKKHLSVGGTPTFNCPSPSMSTPPMALRSRCESVPFRLSL